MWIMFNKPCLFADCSFTAHHGPTMLAHFESVHETRCRLCSHEAKNSTGLRQHRNHAHGRREGRQAHQDIDVEMQTICDRCRFAALGLLRVEKSHFRKAWWNVKL